MIASLMPLVALSTALWSLVHPGSADQGRQTQWQTRNGYRVSRYTTTALFAPTRQTVIISDSTRELVRIDASEIDVTTPDRSIGREDQPLLESHLTDHGAEDLILVEKNAETTGRNVQYEMFSFSPSFRRLARFKSLNTAQAVRYEPAQGGGVAAISYIDSSFDNYWLPGSLQPKMVLRYDGTAYSPSLADTMQRNVAELNPGAGPGMAQEAVKASLDEFLQRLYAGQGGMAKEAIKARWRDLAPTGPLSVFGTAEEFFNDAWCHLSASDEGWVVLQWNGLSVPEGCGAGEITPYQRWNKMRRSAQMSADLSPHLRRDVAASSHPSAMARWMLPFAFVLLGLSLLAVMGKLLFSLYLSRHFDRTEKKKKSRVI